MLSSREIGQYITRIRAGGATLGIEDSFVDDVADAPSKPIVKVASAVFILKSIIHLLCLRLQLSLRKNNTKRIVFTSARFTSVVNGRREDRVVKPLFTDNIIFINQSKEIWLDRINGQKVYNIGGVTKLLGFLLKSEERIMRDFFAYQKINRFLLATLQNSREIYFLVHYDLANLSIIFSEFRHRLRLIEIQHGGIINYFPYAQPAPIKMIDVFYVKNKATINYLKQHLCKHFDCEYNLLPYPVSAKKQVRGKHILYASTVEIGGVHPVLLEYLKNNQDDDLTVYVRLHPREKDNEPVFRRQLLDTAVSFEFDYSKNWLASNEIANVVVVSPWSSMIEDAADNGYKAIILEPFGKERFGYLIDDENVIFAPEESTFRVKLEELFQKFIID